MFHFRSFHYAIKSSIYIFIAFNGSVLAFKEKIIFRFCKDLACQSIKTQTKVMIAVVSVVTYLPFLTLSPQKNLTDASVLRETSQSVL